MKTPAETAETGFCTHTMLQIAGAFGGCWWSFLVHEGGYIAWCFGLYFDFGSLVTLGFNFTSTYIVPDISFGLMFQFLCPIVLVFLAAMFVVFGIFSLMSLGFLFDVASFFLLVLPTSTSEQCTSALLSFHLNWHLQLFFY
jgi:hypothetical protein